MYEIEGRRCVQMIVRLLSYHLDTWLKCPRPDQVAWLGNGHRVVHTLEIEVGFTAGDDPL